MFTSSGYFRVLNCPYFVNGLCERTYCHFRHYKPNPEKDTTPALVRSVSKDAGENTVPAVYGGPSCFKPSKEWSSNNSKEKHKPDAEAEDAAQNNKEEEEADNAGTDGSKMGPYGKYWPTQQYEPVIRKTSSSVKYIPTPITALQGKKEAEKIVPTHAKGGAMLEYNPTPIAHLQQMRQKSSQRLRGKAAKAMEYDPESNFSTVHKTTADGLKSRKRALSTECDTVEYVPTKRKHIDIEAEFSEEEYQSEDVENLPEYVPTSVTAPIYPIDTVDIGTDSKDNGGNLDEEAIKEDSGNNIVPESKLSMSDYLKLLLNPTTSAASKAQNQLEVKKKDTKLSTNKARANLEKRKIHNSSPTEPQNDDSSKDNKTSGGKLVKSSSSDDYHSSKHGKKDRDKSGHGSSKDSGSVESRKESRNGDGHSHKSKSQRHNDKRSSNSHRSSSSKDKSSSSSSAKSSLHRSDSSKNQRRNSKSQDLSPKTNPTSHDKSRYSSSSERSRSSDSHKHRLSKDSGTPSSNGHGKGHRKSSEGHAKSNGDLHGEKKLLSKVNLDLFGADSDVCDDRAIDWPVTDAGDSQSRNGAFNGDSSDSELETGGVLLQSDMSNLDKDVDTYEECLRIFRETGGKLKLPSVGKSSHKHTEEEDPPPTSLGKKRVAHKAQPKEIKKIAERPMAKLSPAQVMHNRFVQMQLAAKSNQPNTPSTSKSRTAPGTSLASRQKEKLTISTASKTEKREAHVPVIPSTSKSRTAPGTSLASRQKEKLTISTASKTEKRKAHVPVIASLPRPTVPAEFGGKIPTNVRQRYLNVFIDECLKLCRTEKEAYDRALEEEKACYSRASSRNIYLNVCVNAIKKLRVEVSTKNSKKSGNANPAITLSHQAVLGGIKATQVSFTLNRSQAPKAQTQDFLCADLYKRLQPYILTEEQLVENGFPRWNPDNPGSPFVKERDFGNKSPTKAVSKGNNKICIRCGKRFEVYPNGKYAVKEECIYHWGKPWKRRIAGSIDTRYTCCSSELDVKGCEVCPYHVHESNKISNLSGFMTTLPSSPPVDGDYGAYAMDCEMVYTFGGCELARVTVLAPDKSVIYESLVKPDKPVIDCNTRFSGIKAGDLKNVTTTLRDVQAVLLSLLTEKTILIGHSLESDLMATKLIHSTVVDTSVVYPHRLGPPYKRALKTLMAEYMKKIIQDDVGGHDSHEDAASCLDLMQLKLKEDAKRELRRN